MTDIEVFPALRPNGHPEISGRSQLGLGTLIFKDSPWSVVWIRVVNALTIGRGGFMGCCAFTGDNR